MKSISIMDIGLVGSIDEFYLFEFQFDPGELHPGSITETHEVIFVLNADHNSYQIYLSANLTFSNNAWKLMYKEFYDYFWLNNPIKCILQDLTLHLNNCK